MPILNNGDVLNDSAMARRSARPDQARKVFRLRRDDSWWFALVAIPWLLLLIGGCRKASPAPSESKPDAAAKREAERQAAEIIGSVAGLLQGNPDPSVYPVAIKQLNQYLERQSTPIPDLPAPLREQITNLLGPDVAGAADGKSFIPQDAEYLKGVLALQNVASRLDIGGKADLALAERLFEWVDRQILIVPPGYQAEGTPFDVCLRGSGNAYERSWVFLELLRQAGLNGVMVGVPQSEQPDQIVPWLAGVLVKDSIYLFEPSLGVPVLNRSGTIATLKELADDPLLVDQFHVDKDNPYEFRSSQARDFSLLLILEGSMVAPRMRFLEQQLSGSRRAILSVPLDQLLDQAQTAAAKVPQCKGIRLWQYPQRVSENLRTQGRRALFASLNPAWITGPKSARLAQLRGDWDDAVKQFVKLDADNLNPNVINRSVSGMPSVIRRAIAGQTRQDVLYFGGLAQLERHPPSRSVAVAWFKRYLDRYGQPSLRADEILSISSFWQSLTQESAASEPSPGKRIESLFPGLAALAKASLELGPRLQRPTPEPNASAELIKSAEAFKRNSPALSPESIRQIEQIRELAKDEAVGDPGDRVAACSHRLMTLWTAILGDVLSRRDLYDPPSFAAAVSSPEIEPGLALLLADPNTLRSETLIRRRNRLLLDVAFPDSFANGRAVWIAGAHRHSAIALHEEGKKAEAIKALRTSVPELWPIQRLASLVLARRWDRAGP